MIVSRSYLDRKWQPQGGIDSGVSEFALCDGSIYVPTLALDLAGSSRS